MNDALQIAREALHGRRAWLVGGAVRDHVLGRPSADLDLVIEGDPGEGARKIAELARANGSAAACFVLSEEFGAWRVVARDGSWQVDVERLRGGSLQEDLALRDFTVNAVAEPLEGGHAIDPLGGLEDLREGRLRMAARDAFADDPLRVLRLVRVAVELGLEPEPQAIAAAREHSGELARISPERVFEELRRIVACEQALRGLELMDEVGATKAVLGELHAMKGVQQSRYHHRDVYGHTLEVLDRTVALTGADGHTGPVAMVAFDERHGPALRALLAEPLADSMTRGEALRWAALLHDAAKPATRSVRLDGRVTFIGHDALGAELAREVLGRLRASIRLREHVGALVRHHLRLGFLVHEPQPLARGIVFEYLRDCGPVAVDVTLLSVCDRLATRGQGSEESIEAHLHLARRMLGEALRWRLHGPPRPLLRGDDLSAQLGISPGPRIGELLAELARAQYVGEVSTPEQAIEFARAAAAKG
jgi:poly(A) polymerase